MATRPNDELGMHEASFEDELGMHEANHEDELEAALHEDELGMHEASFEDELGMNEASFEDELGMHELGMHEASFEDELGMHEASFEDELGMNEGEQFFKKFRGLARGIGGFIRKAAPILKSVARVAVPMVAGAVGGPLGGMLGKVASQALREDEAGYEDELQELGLTELGMHEASFEDELGMLESSPEASHELLAEVMAEVAAGAQHEAEAEAMIGAAAVSTLSAADQAALRRLVPHLVRGAAVLTRILRRRRITRPAVRTIPTILRTTARTIRRRAAAGRPVNRRVAGQIMGSVTRRVLSNPRVCGAVITRNLKAGRKARPVSG